MANEYKYISVEEIPEQLAKNGFKLSIEEVEGGGEFVGVVRKGDLYSAFSLDSTTIRDFIVEFLSPAVNSIAKKIVDEASNG